MLVALVGHFQVLQIVGSFKKLFRPTREWPCSRYEEVLACATTKADAAKTFGEKQYPVVRRQYEGEWVVARDLGSVKEPKASEEREFEIANGVKMVFCWIPAGEAQLGSPKEKQDYLTKTYFIGKQPDFLDDETEFKRGKHKTQGFWLGKYPVTQGEWKAVMGNNPSYFDGTNDNKAKGMD
ncbi:MAG TPA: SUMF1/EgtB/PvdO family nonheme iron enzyme, partial [Gemmata sp.]|nr:SUMF1/EgtB/PvdO family nonheme iron enzyme [Gemmata sp.]